MKFAIFEILKYFCGEYKNQGVKTPPYRAEFLF